MKQLTISLSDNPVGVDPKAILFNAVAKQYPALGFTQDNAFIGTIMRWPAKYKPARTYMKIVSNSDPRNFAEFYYDRFDVTLYVFNPIFTDAEGAALADATGLAVLTAISAKVKQNFTEADFWVESYQFTHTGGTNPPNFRLKARHNSPFWYGDMVVWLHSKTAAAN